MKKNKAFILIYLFAIIHSYGQQDELIYKYRQMAVEYQQQIKMAKSDFAGAESTFEAAKADFLPKLDLTGDYTYLGNTIQLPSAGIGQPGEELSNTYSLGLGVFQPIVTGGYLKNTKNVALSQVEVMRNYITLNEQDVMINSDALYWDAVTKKEINSIQIQYRNSIGKFLKVIQDRVDEEVVGMNELYQTKVRYNDAEYEVIKSNKEYLISLMRLNRLIGQPINAKLTVADSLQAINITELNGNLTEKALSQRSEIEILKNTVAMNEFNEKITTSKYNPQLGVGVGGNWGAPSAGLSIDPDFNYNVYAQLVVPVFHWGKRKDEVFASRQLTEVAKLEMDETKDLIGLEVETSYKDLQLTQQQLDFATNSLDNAQKNVDVMLDRYYEGLSSVIEVLDAELYWQKTYFNYVQAKYELNFAHSSYQRAMGEISVNP